MLISMPLYEFLRCCIHLFKDLLLLIFLLLVVVSEGTTDLNTKKVVSCVLILKEAYVYSLYALFYFSAL